MTMLTTVLVALVSAQKERTGNCISGRYVFDRNRMFFVNYAGEFLGKQLDESRYDFTIDYGLNNTRILPGNAIELTLQRQPSGLAQGVRIATTRYVQYARVTTQMTAIDTPGVVSSFITMGENHDEIDFETVGKDRMNIQSNVFARGIPERSEHGGVHRVNDITRPHQYTIDWNSERIIWSVDGQAVRTHRRNGPEANRPKDRERGHPWYPTVPSTIQWAVWESRTQWAGAPIPWGNRDALSLTIDWLQVDCYNDQNQIVPKWPLNDNPDLQEALPNQPVVNGTDQSFRNVVGAGGGLNTLVSPTPTSSSTSKPTETPTQAVQPQNPSTADRNSAIMSSHSFSFLFALFLLL